MSKRTLFVSNTNLAQVKTRYYQSLTKSNPFSFVKDKFSFHLVFFGVDAKRNFSLTRSSANEFVQVIVDIVIVTVHLHVLDEKYS